MDGLYRNLLKQLRYDLVEMTQRFFKIPLTLSQIAEMLGCSYTSLYKKIQNGYIQSEIVNGNLCIRLEDIVQSYEMLCEHSGRKARRKNINERTCEL